VRAGGDESMLQRLGYFLGSLFSLAICLSFPFMHGMHDIIFILLACTPFLSAGNWSKEAVLAGSVQFFNPQ
jgi:hypothetical protein